MMKLKCCRVIRCSIELHSDALSSRPCLNRVENTIDHSNCEDGDSCGRRTRNIWSKKLGSSISNYDVIFVGAEGKVSILSSFRSMRSSFDEKPSLL